MTAETREAPGRDAGFQAGRQAAPWALLALVVLAPAGGDGLPPEPPRYQPLQPDCARYETRIRTDITIQAGRRRTRETAGRDGIMVLRAAATDSLIRLEGWFDTLALWRESDGERQTPDTDGLVGGRYRGTLTSLGGFNPTDTPFIPDEVAELADMSHALGDLLPPLPPVALKLGGSWKDDLGTVISRTSDSRIAGRPVERYRLVRRAERQESRLLPDSTEVSATRTENESGVFSWSPELGVLRWERDLEEQVTVPAGGLVKQPFKTGIVQKVTVVRSGGGSCGN